MTKELNEIKNNGRHLFLVDFTAPEDGKNIQDLEKMQISSHLKIGWTYVPKFENVETSQTLEEL